MNGSDYFDLWYQLREIKALLIAVLVAMGFIVVIFGLLARSFAKANRAVRINLEARAFQVEASALLDQGSYTKLKELASGRVISSPGDPLAQYYLGIAYFRCKEY